MMDVRYRGSIQACNSLSIKSTGALLNSAIPDLVTGQSGREGIVRV